MNEKKQRLVALDLARILAMGMMVVGHSFFDLAQPHSYNIGEFPWNFWEFARGLTAPLFLFISGIVQVFANKRDSNGKLPQTIVHRRVRTAFLLIFIGYFLNFPVRQAYHFLVVDKIVLIPFFQVNILQLIGFSLLFVVVLFSIIRNNRTLGIVTFLLGLLILVFNPLVHLVDWYEILPLPIAPYFSLAKGSYFTIFPFSAFLLFGVSFGAFLQRFEPETRYKNILKFGSLFGLILLPVGLIVYFAISHLNLPFFDAFKGNPGMSIIRLSLVLFIISLIVLTHLLYLKKFPIVENISTTLGKNSLFIYVIHLLLLYGLPWYSGLATTFGKTLSIAESFFCSFAILAISFALVFIFEYFGSKEKLAKPILKYGLISLSILLLIV